MLCPCPVRPTVHWLTVAWARRVYKRLTLQRDARPSPPCQERQGQMQRGMASVTHPCSLISHGRSCDVTSPSSWGQTGVLTHTGQQASALMTPSSPGWCPLRPTLVPHQSQGLTLGTLGRTTARGPPSTLSSLVPHSRLLQGLRSQFRVYSQLLDQE